METLAAHAGKTWGMGDRQSKSETDFLILFDLLLETETQYHSCSGKSELIEFLTP